MTIATSSRHALAIALVTTLPLAGPAFAGSFEFSSTADWETGSFASTNAGPPGFDQVQLNDNIVTTFNHIWVAASGRGTVIRIDTNSGTVLGEYYSAPDGRGRDPSRTTVDNNGDVWVGNRAESSTNPATGTAQGSVAKISASATGPDTSTGVWNASTGAPGTFDARPWTNAGGADNAGGTSTAADVAILQYVRTPGTANRTIAVDAGNDVWVGGYNNKLHQNIDGDSGALVGAAFTMNPGGYGGVIDSNGILYSSGWSSATITRYDTGTVSGAPGPLTAFATGGSSYGLAVDSGGNIWNSHYNARTISKIAPDGTRLFTVPSGGDLSRGVAVTPDDNIWVANSGSNTVTRLSNDGVLLATVPTDGYPTGVAVDSNGKVWVTNLNGNSAQRIDPATNTVDLRVDLGPGAAPYNYSDMTGSVIGGITNPRGTWRSVLDSGSSGTTWEQILWNTEAEGATPDGTSIMVEVRTADMLGDLGAATWQSYASGAFVGLLGQFAEVRATLTRTGTGVGAVSPVLSDLKLTFSTADGVVPLPAPLWLLLSGLAVFAGLRRRQTRAA
jgi:streptogramin lyase